MIFMIACQLRERMLFLFLEHKNSFKQAAFFLHAPSGCQSRSTSCSAPDPPFRALPLEASAPLNRQHIHDNKYGRHKSALLAFSFSFSFFLRQFLVNLMKPSQLNQLTPLHSRYILPYFLSAIARQCAFVHASLQFTRAIRKKWRNASSPMCWGMRVRRGMNV